MVKAYRYNLDQTQAKHFAGLKSGDEFVIVVPLPKQPPEGYKVVRRPFSFNEEGAIDFIPDKEELIPSDVIQSNMPYPIGARVGLREAWARINSIHGEPLFIYRSNPYYDSKYKWRSAQCMPVDAINQCGNWSIVTDARVCRVQDMSAMYACMSGIQRSDKRDVHDRVVEELERFKQRFNRRYGKDAWLKNLYVEVVTMRKE